MVAVGGGYQGGNCPPPLKYIDCSLFFSNALVFQEFRSWRGNSRYEPSHKQQERAAGFREGRAVRGEGSWRKVAEVELREASQGQLREGPKCQAEG